MGEAAVARRVAFRPAAPDDLRVSEPTRVALMRWADGSPEFLEPPPGVEAYASTVVAVWPSRAVVAWHVTAEQLERLVDLHREWPLDRFDVCVYPDGRIMPRMETMRDVVGFSVGAEVERVAARLGAR